MSLRAIKKWTCYNHRPFIEENMEKQSQPEMYTKLLVLICFNLEPHAFLNSNQTLSEVLLGASAGKTHWPHQNHYIGSSKPQAFFVYFSLEFDGAVVDDLTLKHRIQWRLKYGIWNLGWCKVVSAYHYCIKGYMHLNIVLFLWDKTQNQQ